jgi:hypothetical protein
LHLQGAFGDQPEAPSSCLANRSAYLGAMGLVGPVGVPADPPEVLVPKLGFVGPVEKPPDPPALLRPNPGDVLPAVPGTPAGAPTAPPAVPRIV